MLHQLTQTWFSSENKTLVLGRIWLWECEQEGKINLPKLFSCHEGFKTRKQKIFRNSGVFTQTSNETGCQFLSRVVLLKAHNFYCGHRGSAKAISKNFSKEWENIISGFQNKINKIYLIKVRGQQCNKEYILQRPGSGVQLVRFLLIWDGKFWAGQDYYQLATIWMFKNVYEYSLVWSFSPQLILSCFSKETVHKSEFSLHWFSHRTPQGPSWR